MAKNTYLAVIKSGSFTEAQNKMIGTIWHFRMGSMWFYLSDNIIKQYLIADNKTLTKYKESITKSFMENVSYKIVKQEDPVVIKYFKTIDMWSFPPRIAATEKITSKKKFMLITGATFKGLLMKSEISAGRDLLSFFNKCHDLYLTIRKQSGIEDDNESKCESYIDTCEEPIKIKLSHDMASITPPPLTETEITPPDTSETHSSVSDHTEIDTIKSELELAKEQIKLLKIKQYKSKNIINKEYIYIVTTDTYQDNDWYKVGRTNDIKRRLGEYNGTGIAESSKYYYVYIKETYMPDIVEKALKTALGQYRENIKKELYIINGQLLVQIVDRYVNAINEMGTFTAKAIDDFIQSDMNTTKLPPI